MYDEDDLLPLSGLQHLMFCERQWALIHLEGLWLENRLTAEGRSMHVRSHEEKTEVRGDVRFARGLRLRSLKLGLSGKADLVEFHRVAGGDGEGAGVPLPDAPGFWRSELVEYKRGRPKENRCDEIQLCAQAICLEEMLSVPIEKGALYYGQPHRRFEVLFDAKLRGETETQSEKMHRLFETSSTAAGKYDKRCDACSLLSVCMPGIRDVQAGAQETRPEASS